MRKVLFILVLALAGLFPLLRYHPAATEATQSTPAPSAPAPPSATAPPDPGSPSSSSPSAPSPAGGPPSARIVDGSKVDTDFGPYQVRATFSAGRITDVQLITEPSDRHSRRIATMAASSLRAEALQAQSARIDTISGATQTSEAYAQSLQAAIDAKGN